MCQDCLTAALPIVSPSLVYCPGFLLTMVTENCPQTDISCTSRVLSSICGDGELRVWTIQTLNSWPLQIAPAHSRVGEGARLLRRKSIDWLWNVCGRNATERRKPLKSVLRGSRGMPFCARCSHQACATVVPVCVRCGRINTSI